MDNLNDPTSFNSSPSPGEFVFESAKTFGKDWGGTTAKVGLGGFLFSEALNFLMRREGTPLPSPALKEEAIRMAKSFIQSVIKPGLLAGAVGTGLGSAATLTAYHEYMNQHALDKQASDEYYDPEDTDGNKALVGSLVGGVPGALGGGALGYGIGTGKINPTKALRSELQIPTDVIPTAWREKALQLAKEHKGELALGLAAIGGLAGAGFGSMIGDTSEWAHKHLAVPAGNIRNRLLVEHEMETPESAAELPVPGDSIPDAIKDAAIGTIFGAAPLSVMALKDVKRGRGLGNLIGQTAKKKGGNLFNPVVAKSIKIGLPLAGAGIGAGIGTLTDGRKGEEA